MKTKELKINRLVAKGIDFFISVFILICLHFFKTPTLGMFAAIAYLVISDGFFDGQSLGKKLVGIKVIAFRGDEISKCNFKSSVTRNVILIPMLFSQIFIIGWLLLLLGVVVVAIETYFTYSDEQGRRIGDVLAGTLVVDTASEGASQQP